MFTRLRQFLAPPVFEGDEEKSHTAAILNTLAIAAGILLLMAGLLHIPTRIGQPDVLPNVVRLAITVLFMVLTLVFIRQGRVRAGAVLFTAAIWISTLITSYTTGGIQSPELPTFVVVVLAVGLLLGMRAAMGTMALSILAWIGLIAVEQAGWLLPFDPESYTPGQIIFSRGLDMVAVIVLVHLASRGISQVLERARTYARELEAQRGELEHAVAERTADLAERALYLETTALIAREMAAELDLRRLLSHAADLIGDRFGFYHTGIFLLDETREWAVLEAASGAGGQGMLDQGHRQRLGQAGVVGYVGARGQARLIRDATQEGTFSDDPYLPETCSEVALPLRARGEILGVLDVQSRQAEAFGDEHVAVLQTLADQVALAISNARLFEQVQESLEAERQAYGELTRQDWREALRARPELGILRNAGGLSPAEDVWRPEMEAAARRGETVLDDGGEARLAVPIKVAGQTIGVLDVQKREATDPWAAEEITLLEVLMEQLGVALDSARLHEETQHRETRERLVGQVTTRMRGSLDVETVLRTAVNEMYEALGLDELTIRLAASAGNGDPAGDGAGLRQQRDDGEVRRP